MKKSELVQPEGNYYDKYHSNNPIVKWMMSNFIIAMKELLAEVKERPIHICEAGCGEGNISILLHELYAEARIDSFDISEKVVREARNRVTGINFWIGNIYDMTVVNPDEKIKYALNNDYNLVVCSEVLEHLESPERALKKIKELLADEGVVLLSVPNEPIWRVLNMCRGKYWKEFGNTPGHIQHWSKKKFYAMLKKNDWNIIDQKSPFPWTMVLVTKR